MIQLQLLRLRLRDLNAGDHMSRANAASLALAVIAASALASQPAVAGKGREVGAGLLGFGVGAIVGSTLAPREVYIAPPPPPPPPPSVFYGPASYGPAPWSPAWYGYCREMFGPSFNPNTGYFLGPDGGWYFCE